MGSRRIAGLKGARARAQLPDLSIVNSYFGAGPAGASLPAMNAPAFTSGSQVAFMPSLDLHTAAHEAAYEVQRRGLRD